MPPKSCGFLIYRERPEGVVFLLMEHPNRLDLPKGHVDEGETEMQCALRELEEETGITADAIDVHPTFRFEEQYMVKYKKRFSGEPVMKTLVIFLGRLHDDADIHVTEHGGFRWVAWNPPHDIQANTINPLLDLLARENILPSVE